MGRFLQIAMGSASEVAYLLLRAKDLGYFSVTECKSLSGELNEIRRMLTVFYKRIRDPKKVPAITVC
jgi:four helix bundle protein